MDKHRWAEREQRQTGLVVQPADRDALRDTLQSLRDSPEHRVELSERALERAYVYTPERYGELNASTMESLVAGQQ